MTHWKQNFDYKFTGAYELQPGEERTVTITSTTHEDVNGSDGKKQNCFVAYFKESSKPMVLNKTNCKTISKLYGPYVENWTGKQITIKAESVKAFGEIVEALRIKNIKPEIKKVDYTEQVKMLRNAKSIDMLKSIYSGFSPETQAACLSVKDEMKLKLL